jgi:heptosyltransferase-2
MTVVMKILIIRLSSIGDIILTQPIVHKLHEVFPEAELHYLTKQQYAVLPDYFGVPLKVIPYAKTIGFHYFLSRSKYDYVFDLQAKFSSFLIKLACGTAFNFTYNKQHWLRRAIVRHKTERNINSTLDLYQTALLKAGKALKNESLSVELPNPTLFVEKSELDNMKKRLQIPEGRKIVALFPGATHLTKQYPVESLIKVIQKAGSDFHFWLLGSKAETGLIYNLNFATADRSTEFGGKFSLSELIAVITLADIVLTNDSGPMHIAAAMGKPQIAIFGATHPKLGFKPLNPSASVIVKNKSCQPCSLHGGEGCPQKHFACMLSIEPDEIVSLLKTLSR